MSSKNTSGAHPEEKSKLLRHVQNITQNDPERLNMISELTMAMKLVIMFLDTFRIDGSDQIPKTNILSMYCHHSNYAIFLLFYAQQNDTRTKKNHEKSSPYLDLPFTHNFVPNY
jgi:hypothetical protein